MRLNRNLITGDVCTNVKGDAEQYGANYDAIKGGKPMRWVHDFNKTRILHTQDEVDELNEAAASGELRTFTDIRWKMGDSVYWHKQVDAEAMPSCP